jgi:beta-N-acetylhexosaminidase
VSYVRSIESAAVELLRKIILAFISFIALTVVIIVAWMSWRLASSPSTTAPTFPAVEAVQTQEPMPTLIPTTESRTIMTSTSEFAVLDPGARIDEILATMTVEEKVGQLFMVFFFGPTLSPELRQMIEEYHIGGIVLFAIVGNIESPPQVAGMINDAQALAVTSGARIPLFVSIDQEGGTVVRLTEGFTVFPSQMAVGATGSTELAGRMAEVTAQELKALGINMNLAPVFDVNNNPDNPVIGLRSFGSSPELVSALGTVMIERYRQMGVIPTAKHFPGHGDTVVDSHYGLPVVPHNREHLDQVEFPPFRAAIAVGIPAIMTAHVLFPAIDPSAGSPATLSSLVLEGLLRQEMGFDGLIVTDSLSMGALANLVGTTEAAQLAFRAGADVLAYGADIGHTPDESLAAYRRLLGLVQSGEISEDRLDASVRRILSVKEAYGLLDWQPTDLDVIAGKVGSADHRAVAAEIARQSITLVRNVRDLVPLREGEQALVAWPAEVGDLGERLAFCRKDLILRPLGLSPNATEIEQILADAPIAAKIVIGTVNARRFPAQVQLIEALADRPLIVAALGEPYDLLAFPQVDSYIATYGAQPISLDALAQVLCGEIDAQGALPVEFPGLPPLGERGAGGNLVVYLPSTMKEDD